MKIALVIGNYDAQGGGAERWTDRHARWLVGNGYEVHLFARRFREPPPEAVCHEIVAPGGWSRSKRLGFAEAVERRIGSQTFDCVHDMGDGWCANLFMPHHGTRIGGFIHNTRMFPGPLRRLRELGQALLPRYREFADLERRQFALAPGKRFIAVSKMIAGHMQKYYGVPEERIHVVYNGVDVDRFYPASTPERRSARLRLGLPAEERVILLVAHNFRLKGVPTAIRALARLWRGKERAALLVVGGDEPSGYRRLAERLGCQAAVAFVGSQSDPLTCFHAADVLVHPTYYDPCSLVVLEALACGLPVVTTQCNGAAELITAGAEGYALADPSDAAGLAEYLKRCLAQRSVMTAAARTLAERSILQRNAQEICALYANRETARYTPDRLRTA